MTSWNSPVSLGTGDCLRFNLHPPPHHFTSAHLEDLSISAAQGDIAEVLRRRVTAQQESPATLGRSKSKLLRLPCNVLQDLACTSYKGSLGRKGIGTWSFWWFWVFGWDSWSYGIGENARSKLPRIGAEIWILSLPPHGVATDPKELASKYARL